MNTPSLSRWRACLCLSILPPALLSPAAHAQLFGTPDKLTVSDALPGDLLGSGIAGLSANGNRILVGKPLDDDHCPPGPDHENCNAGAAYLFERIDGQWTETAKLKASDAARGDFFGSAVALDGNRILIGAPGDSDRGAGAGAVYFFEYRNGQWQQRDKFYAGAPDNYDFFGDRNIILRGDEAYVTATADSEANLSAGAIYLFAFDGNEWTQRQKLTNPDAGVADFLGFSMALDGDRLIAGEPAAEKFNGGGEGMALAGRVVLFERVQGTWQHRVNFQPADLDTSDVLGSGVGLSGDWAMGGAPRVDPDDCMIDPGRPIFCDEGKVYVWRRNNATRVWQEVDQLVPGGLEQLDLFGNGLVMVGPYAFISAVGDDDSCTPDDPDFFGTGCNAGAVYVYVLTGDTWQLAGKLAPDELQYLSIFGVRLAADARWLAVGAPGGSLLDAGADPRGAVYVYKHTNTAPTAGDDAATTEAGTPVEVFVLNNDTDPDADHLTLSIATQPAHGAVDFSIEGTSLIYTPNAGFGGQDSFLYQIDDGDRGTDQATVAVSVTSTNSAPVVVQALDDVDLILGGDTFTTDLTTVFSDADGDALVFSASSDAAAVATATVAGEALTVAAVSLGNATITATADDGHGGMASTSFEVGIETAVSVEERAGEVLEEVALFANYPNPFNPETRIAFALPQASQVRLVVYDVLGRAVAVVVDARLPAGWHEAIFQAANLPGGVYAYQMQAEGRTWTRSMVVVK